LLERIDYSILEIKEILDSDVNNKITPEKINKAIDVHKESVAYNWVMCGLTAADIVVEALSISLLFPTLGGSTIDVVFSGLSILGDVLNVIEYGMSI
jgi:hypothetical protein